MDFWDLTKLVFRRWYVAVPLLVVTVVAAAMITTQVKPDYKATSYVQLIPPPDASTTTNVAELRNPWLDLGLGALNTAATYATVDKTFLNQLKEQGFSDNVVITDGYPAPIATIEVVGHSQEQASTTTDQVVKRFNDVVKQLQDDYGVRSKGLVVTRRLDTGKNLAQTGGKVKRALIAVAGAGVLFTIGLTIGFDAAARRISRRRAQQRLGDPGESTVAINTTAVSAAAWLHASRAAGAAGETNGSRAGPVEHRSVGVPEQRDVASQAEIDEPVSTPIGSDVTIVLPRPKIDAPGSGDGGGRRR